MVNPGAPCAASYHRPLVNHDHLRSPFGGIYRRMASSYATADDQDIGINFVLLAIIYRVRPSIA